MSSRPKGVRFMPEVGRTGENPPSHLIHVGRVEIGAVWPQKAASGREHHSVKLDDPKLSAPISANLFADDKGDGYGLIWPASSPEDRLSLTAGPAPASGAKTDPPLARR